MSAFTLADCTETEYDSQTLSRLATLATILEDKDGSVLDFSQQRVYVNPEKIGITNQGLIIYTTAEREVLLPELFSCDNGCFVSCSTKDLEILSKNDELRIWWCNGCQAFRRMDDYGRCKGCGRKL